MTEPHLSLDALADLLAAEGSPADEAHVATCAGCAGRLDELASAEVEVAAVLASLPAPPVPAGLAERLQAAFDAEPALEAQPAPVAAPPGEGPVALGQGAGATVTPFPAGSRRPRRWLPAAAAVALVVSGGALGTTLLLSGGGGDDAATTGAAGGGVADDPFGGLTRNETGTDYAADGTLAAALPGLLGGSAAPVTAPLAARGTEQESADSPPRPAAEPDPAAAPGAAVEQRGPAGDVSAAGSPELDRLRTPQGLASCLAALLPPEDDSMRPLAVDYAAFGGQPALVVLLPATGAPGKVDVFVVGAGCRLGDDRTLFFTRLDRP